MNFIEAVQDLIGAVVAQLGVFVEVSLFFLGIILLATAYFMNKYISERTGLIYRIITAAAFVFGVPIFLTSIRVSFGDALVLAFVAMFAAGVWLTAVKGRTVTIIGVVVMIVAFGGWVYATQTAPEGTITAEWSREISKWARSLGSGGRE